MAVPPELLAAAERLQGPLMDLEAAIDQVLAARRDEGSELRVGEAASSLQEPVTSWYESSQSLKERLFEYGRDHPDDRDDVNARIAGLAMLDIAIAADLGLVAALDEANDDELVSRVVGIASEPERALYASNAGLGEGQLIHSLSTPLDADTDDDARPDLDHATHDYVIDDVVSNLVDRGGRSVSAVLFALGGGAFVGAVKDLLGGAFAIVPHDVVEVMRQAERSVKRWIGRLVTAAAHWLRRILGTDFTLVRDFVNFVDPVGVASEQLCGGVMRKIARVDKVRAQAEANLAQVADPDKAIERLQKLKKTNAHWVGPVRYVARGLPLLHAATVAGVPAAPLAGAGLIAWAVLCTGDQLDAPGPFPNVWKGVVRRAAGE
jgi:hypothetical protein